MNFEEYVQRKAEPIMHLMRLAVYPYCERGREIVKALDNIGRGGVEKLDNFSEEKYEGIKKISSLQGVSADEVGIIFSSDSNALYYDLLQEARKYVLRTNIVELFPRFTVGKYSNGPICSNNWSVERIGAFCSFAKNSEVVDNHDVYISSHEFLSFSGDWTSHPGNIPGTRVLHPRYYMKSIIGNDVWVGRNAVILAGCNIGNGAIIGANAVVTKDVPDYAIAVGVPARVIRYRYSPEQISALNKIAWWNWTDEKIKRHQADFYLDVDRFIRLHIDDEE